MTFLATLLISVASLLLGGERASIVFAGDAMQHQSQLDNARTPDGNYDYSSYFKTIEPYISGADYAVVNLETPLGSSGFTGYPLFCAPETYARALRDSGFDLLLTANNHTLDRRDRGLRYTFDALDSLGVDHIGTYPSAAVRANRLPLIHDINGFRVGFLNYTYGTNGIRPQGNVVVDRIDTELIASDVKAARDAGAELIAICIHWGNEYQLLPSSSQRQLADRLTSLDVDMIIGSHPHVIQPMEMRKNPSTGRPVFLCYSLGNFISGMRTTDTRGGAMVRVTLGRDSLGTARVDGASYRLVFTVAPWLGAKKFHLIDALNDSVPTGAATELSDFRANALAIFDAHNRNVPLDTLPVTAYRRPYQSGLLPVTPQRELTHPVKIKTDAVRP